MLGILWALTVNKAYLWFQLSILIEVWFLTLHKISYANFLVLKLAQELLRLNLAYLINWAIAPLVSLSKLLNQRENRTLTDDYKPKDSFYQQLSKTKVLNLTLATKKRDV